LAQDLAKLTRRFVVMKTLNGENPLVHGGKPILGFTLPVW
jgi:hypothetical protein